MDAGGKWVDGDAGPVVRPYALTGGRTEPVGGVVLDLVAIVITAAPEPGDRAGLGPEQRQILDLCQQPATVADLASATTLPVGVVRVLLADLAGAGWVTVPPNQADGVQPGTDLLKEVLHGLRAL